MATYNKTLLAIAAKLGFAEDDKVVGKAAEFDRLLSTKSTAGSNLSDTSKVAICLDLSASIFGVEFDAKTGIKYSGLKPAMYANCRKTVENLLEINNERLTTSQLCLLLQCVEVNNLADEILDKYQKNCKLTIDLNLPQYVCMSVHQACRINKIKIPKSKLLEKSRLKPSQWNKLEADWTKFVDEHFSNVRKKKGKLNKTDILKDQNEDLMDIDISDKTRSTDTEPKLEPYENWKRRMLEIAYKELKEIARAKKNVEKSAKSAEKVNSMTPRRSPRKTPQKFSPYKTHTKEKGVRLLFPV